MKKSNTLLFDGDMVVFQITIGHETEVQWDNDVHTLHSRFSDCLDTFNDYMKNIVEELNADDCIFTFSGSDNFRKTVLPTYKSNRKNTRKPLAYKRLKEHISELYQTKIHEQLEADDVLGILATNGKYKNPIIVSDDKDLYTIPGRTYRLGELREISEQEAFKYFLTQTLTGDVADGYKGCPGIGAKKAETLLSSPETCTWDQVLNTYLAAGLTEDDALAQARVARILHASDWDAKKERVILWQPQTILA